MLPSEVAVVQDVFHQVVAQPWFDRSPKNEHDFAEFVLRSYHEGTSDHGRLLNYCKIAAESRFSV
jgi:hypothetical protein